MDISYNWLRAIAPELPDRPETILDRLAELGAPVEEVIPLGAEITSIVVAQVTEVTEHPNADRLSLCAVDDGSGELLQVVCGAPNVEPGKFYPFAPVGSRLPGGFAIRKAKIRGVESQGMLCSEKELELGRDASGLMELPGHFDPGERLIDALGLDDLRIVIDLTPNRPDLLSHLGVARELAGDGDRRITLPAFPASSAGGLADLEFTRSRAEGEIGDLRVVLEDPRGCPRYMGAIVRGVKIRPSPTWLSSRLRAIGLRPINNVVDATNYILFELGQPLHAFDLNRLAGPEIRIRRAEPGEEITTLDGVERILDEGMTVIADANDPIAVAGVMGGANSEVTDETVDIFLECALFDPRTTRRTRVGVGLSTDASYRFERGVDPEGMERALRRAVELITTIAGGEVESTGVDLYPEPLEMPEIEVRPGQVERILGIHFTPDQIAGLLEPIGFRETGERSGDPIQSLTFRVPGYRSYDVTREADLIEEIARRYGYDEFPADLGAFRPSSVPDDPLAQLEDRLRDLAVGVGFLEARINPFVPEASGEVGPINPLSKAESRLRSELVPGLLRRVEANFAHGVRSIRLFEIGTAFYDPEEEGGAPTEETHIAFVMSGDRRPTHWSSEPEPYDLWDLKGLLEEVANLLSTELSLEVAPSPIPGYLPGTTYTVLDREGQAIGWGGEVDHDAIDAPPWADAVLALELELRPEFARTRIPVYDPIPAYPAIERDLALIVPDELPAATIEGAIREKGGRFLESLVAFDLFRGSGVPEGNRSIAYRLRFRAPDRTLTDAESDEAVTRILDHLREELGVQRRG